MAEPAEGIAAVESQEKGGAPQHEVKSNSPNGHPAQSGNLQSPSGSASKISPNRVDCYWFAQSGDSPSENRASPEKSDGWADPDGRDIKDREERLRYLRERQAGDRHRKLEELKTAAMQAQKYRELQEEDRRRKIEEIKYRDLERRHLVEERKRQIWEAERDRRESMLRKSQEREARIEAMRNSQRSSIGFAFGSCTPRMLDMESSLVFNRRSNSQNNLIPAAVMARTHSAAPASSQDVNGGESGEVVVRKRTSSTYSLNHRNRESAHRHTIHEAFFWENSTSPSSSDVARNSYAQTNGGPKGPSETAPTHTISLRGAPPALFPWDNSVRHSGGPQFGGWSSATDGGDRRLSGVLSGSGVMVGEDLMTQSLTSLAAASLHRGRRKTDLIPTMPLKGETAANTSTRTRSPAPSSPSRPHSSMSQQSLSSHASQTSSVSMRARSAPRRPRPLSVAGSSPDKQVTADERQGRSSEKKATSVPTGKPPRAKSVGADQIAKELEGAATTTTTTPKASPATNPAPTRRPPSSGAPRVARTMPATPKEKPKIAPKPLTLRKQTSKASPLASPTEEQQVTLTKTTAAATTNGHPVNGFSEPSESTRTDEQLLSGTTTGGEPLSDSDSVNLLQDETLPTYLQDELPSLTTEQQLPPVAVGVAEVAVQERIEDQQPAASTTVQSQATDEVNKGPGVVEGKGPVAKVKITTEEEAKAAMAEKRRLAREQAEREAELERQRQEELLRQEEERIRQEEEEQRLWELEQEEMRLADLERLNRAIRVQEQKEEEERLQREEEAKQKVEKEKADLLAKEELEKQRKEAEEKLRREEEERAERRKRVEAIMSRTRGKGGGTNTPPVTTPTKSLEPADALAEHVANSRSTTDSAGQNVDADGSGSLQEVEPTNRQTPPLDSKTDAGANGLGNPAGEHEDHPGLGNHAHEKQTPTFGLQQQHSVAANNRTELAFNEEHTVHSSHTNGFDHHQVMNNQSDMELIMMDSESTPEKRASPLSDDMGRFDMSTPKLEATAPVLSAPMDQLIDLSLEQLSNQHPLAASDMRTVSATHTDHISNEDNVNFNITTIGLDSPFVDNYNKRQEGAVSDLLS